MSQITIQQAADYIINACHEDGIAITNLKLQKLLYYAQAWHLALYDTPLFDADFEAWVHGPVHLETYQRFRHHKWNPISADIAMPNLPEDARDHLEEIMTVFGDYSAFTLEQMTHYEAPWRNARGNLPIDEPSNAIISNEDMQAFYKTLATGNVTEKQAEAA